MLHLAEAEYIPQGWQFPDPLSGQPSPLVVSVVVNFKGTGWSQNKTIEAVWGISKSGTDPRYKAAKFHYQSILFEAGL